MSAEPRLASRLRGLYAITPELSDSTRLLAMVDACLSGGAAAIQYRAKTLGLDRQREQASALRALCRARGVPFIVNDAVELARAVDADGVHLGREDADVRHARDALGARLIGVSCYDDLARVREAAARGADYVAIGSVFASATKPQACRAPLALLGEARRISGLPVVAIGGITQANAREAIAAGADMVAVISALFDAEDVAHAARGIARLFNDSPDGAEDVRAQPRAL
jgi:thiamine-phosphate pyrophosphorylase